MYKVYEQIKFVFIVNFLYGIFPINNCYGDSCKKLKFKIISCPHVYSLLLNTSVLTITILTCKYIDYVHYKRLTMEIHTEYVVWNCMLYQTYNKLIIVLCKIQEFDSERKNNIKHLKSRKYLALIVYLQHICLSITSIYLNFQREEGFAKWTNCVIRLLFSYMAIIRYLAILPYVFTSYAIADRFKSLDSDLRETFLSSLTAEKHLIEVERLRIRHLKLCVISKMLVACFSLPLTTVFGMTYLDIIVKVGVMAVFKEYHFVQDTQMVLCIAFLLSITIYASQNIQSKSSCIIYTLRDLPLSNKSDQFYSLMKQFTLQVKTSSVKVSAGCYFLVNKRTILGIIGSMASFLVAIIQLAPVYFHSPAKNDNLSSATNSTSQQDGT